MAKLGMRPEAFAPGGGTKFKFHGKPNPGWRGFIDVEVLEGDLAGADGPASVFIDIIGRPLTPLSVAGVARRTAYRGAYYAGAAVAVTAPYYPYRPHCGYYPYPPCY